MRKGFLLLAVLLGSVLSGLAQNTMTVSSTTIVDLLGAELTSGQACFLATDNLGTPISLKVPAGGQNMRRAVCVPVTNGALVAPVPNVLLTNPSNACLQLTVTDSSNGQTVLDKGYECLQPSPSAYWCSGSTCNLDSFVPNNAPVVPVTAGPKGDKGDKGDSGVGADPNCHTDGSGNLTCGSVSAPNTRKVRAQQIANGKIEHWDFSNIPTAPQASDYLHSLDTCSTGSTGNTHPDVYYNPQGWNGWKYWMALTPYSGSDAGAENPSICVSQDGTNWQTPPGVTNPLATSTYATNGDYNADTEIIDGLDGSLFVCFEHQNLTAAQGGGAMFDCLQSFDGVNWGNRQTMYHWTDYSVDRPSSPAIIYDGQQWTMYYMQISNAIVNGCANWISMKTAPALTGPWTNQPDLSITPASGKCLWHMNANRIGDQTVLLIEEANSGSYGASGGNLYLAWSQDGVNFDVNNTTPVVASGGSGFASGSLYRSAMVPRWSGGNLKLDIWYVGISSGGWHIGRTQASVPLKFSTGFTFGSAGKASLDTPQGYDVVLDDGNGYQAFRSAQYHLGWADGVDTQVIQFGDPSQLANLCITRPSGALYNRFFINANTVQVGKGNWNQLATPVAAPVSGDVFETINSSGSIGTGATDAGKFYTNGGVKSAPGMQHVRKSTTCTTAATVGATCNFDVTWPVAFADTNYTPVCIGQQGTALPLLWVGTRFTDHVQLTIAATSAAAATFGGADCIAMHD